jgi:hypothetical protein
MSVDDAVSSMRDSTDFTQNRIFTYDELVDQPKLLKNFFSKVLSDSVFVPNFITIYQSAQFKTDVNSEWLQLNAEQYYMTKKPNYIWHSKIKTSEYFWIDAIESYINNKGNMLIKFNSSITVADSWGIEIDKSGLFRYISEAVFFPTKFLPEKNLIWNVLDSNKAEIKFINGEISIVAKIYFNVDYTIQKIETLDKYRALEDGYEKSLYTVYYSNYKLLQDSFLTPTRMEVEWQLPEGKFKYGEFNIEKIIYE